MGKPKGQLACRVAAFAAILCAAVLYCQSACGGAEQASRASQPAVDRLSVREAGELVAAIGRDLPPAIRESRRVLMGTRDPNGPPLVTLPAKGSSDQGIPPMPKGDGAGGVGRQMIQAQITSRPSTSAPADYEYCQTTLRPLLKRMLADNNPVLARLSDLRARSQRLARWLAAQDRWPADLAGRRAGQATDWPSLCLERLLGAVADKDLAAARRWSGELAAAIFALEDLHRWLGLLSKAGLTSLDFQAMFEAFHDRHPETAGYDRHAISRYPGGSWFVAGVSNYSEIERQAAGLLGRPDDEAAVAGRDAGAAATAAVNLPPHERAAFAKVRGRLSAHNQAVLDRAAGMPYERSFLANTIHRISEAGETDALGESLERFDRRYPRAEVWQLMDIFVYRSSLATSGVEWGDRFDERLMAAAGKLTATQPAAALEAAREFQYGVYGGSGNYAGNVLTLRRSLDTGKMDCIRATDMIAAVLRNAGVPGFLHVRWTRGPSGHSVAAVASFDAAGRRRIDIVDGLFPPGTPGGTWPEEYHQDHSDLASVELFGRGLDSFIWMEGYAIQGPKRGTLVRFDVPYLPRPAPATPGPAAASSGPSVLAYEGALKDGSKLTVRLRDGRTEVVFANGWRVDSATVSGTEFPRDLAAVGRAGDRTLAVSGCITESKAVLEIKRGVGVAAEVQKAVLVRMGGTSRPATSADD